MLISAFWLNPPDKIILTIVTTSKIFTTWSSFMSPNILSSNVDPATGLISCSEEQFSVDYQSSFLGFDTPSGGGKKIEDFDKYKKILQLSNIPELSLFRYQTLSKSKLWLLNANKPFHRDAWEIIWGNLHKQILENNWGFKKKEK